MSGLMVRESAGAEQFRFTRESACSLPLYVITLVAMLNSRSAKIDSHPVS